MHYSKIKYEIKLLLIFILTLLSFLSIEFFFTSSKERSDASKMKEAEILAETWFNKIDRMKKERRIFSDVETNIKYSSLIGNEFTDITTTLGSLEAKEISTNPKFAALFVKYLTDAGIDSSKTVGIILSGSFPALAISSLAAAQTLKLNVVLLSSLGASTFGANQPGATWIEMEKYLIEKGSLKHKSLIITTGAEDDNGGGLSEEGLDLMKNIANCLNVDLYRPASLKESIERKLDLFLENKVDLVINIGGNQTSLGSCAHSSNIPNGFQNTYKSCNHLNRGIIARVSENNIPFINILNIKILSIENDISINHSNHTDSQVYYDRKIKKIPVIVLLLTLSTLLLFLRTFKRN